MNLSEKTRNTRGKSSQLIWLLITASLILLARRFDQLIHPQFWAEDGRVFFTQAEELGIRSVFKFYGGYLHLVPRIIASGISVMGFSYYNIPGLYALATYLITLLVTWRLWLDAHTLGIRHRFLYALTFLLVPVCGEIYVCLTAINFIVSLLLISFLLAGRHLPERSPWWTLLLATISLTGPASFILSPAIVLMLIAERKQMSWQKRIPYMVICAGGIVQALGIFVIDKGFFRGAPGDPEKYHLIRNFTNNVSDVFMAHPLFHELPQMAFECLAGLLFIVILFVSYIAYFRINDKRRYLLPLVATLYFASFIQSYWPMDSRLLGLNVARYHFTPYVCLAWLLIWGYDEIIRFIHLALLAVILSYNYKRMNFTMRDRGWKKQMDEYFSQKRQVVEITPDGWQMEMPKK